MKIIVDTNIIFSTILNSNNTIGDILFNSSNIFEFYSCNYMRYEIQNHWERLKKISKLNDTQLETARLQVFSKIKFINEDIIPESIWLTSEAIAKNIDIDDLDFIALTLFLNGILWTGDKVLYKGLEAIKFNEVINTQDLLVMRSNNF